MNEFMKVAKDLAHDNLETKVGGPFGACIVKDGQIVGRGSNHVIGDNDPTAHAEVMAIRDACQVLGTYDLSGCEIYTTCYPCPMCLSAIIWSNIKKVYYGNSSLDAADIGFRDDFIYNYIKNKDDNVLELINIDHDETIKEFQEYKNSEDKVIY